jgi:hypothetical protein
MPGTAVRLLLALSFGLAGRAPQEPRVAADAMIRLQRTPCLGTCPVYVVTIEADGTVTYEGEQFVRVVGRRQSHIEPAAVTALLARAERIRFDEMRDAYRVIDNGDGSVTTVTDLPTTIVTVRVHGRTKRVEDYVAAPDALGEFERAIDETAGSQRWISVDQETLAALLESGWSASGDEGARLLRDAIGRDDVAIARALIEAGADLEGPSDSRLPSLLFARSAAMVRLLVAAGADPNERPIGRVGGRTPLMETAHREPDVAAALLEAGAILEDLDDGHSALWYAACAGNWRVVTVLLRAGADVRGAADLPAIECARRARAGELNRRRTILDRDRPTTEDFDKVIALLESPRGLTPR